MFEIHVGELRATFLRNHNMRRHKDPSRRQPKQKTPTSPATTTGPGSTSLVQQAEDAHIPGNHHKHGGAAPDKGHCTRYVAVHPLRGGAPEQKRCIAYGSGAVPQQTRTNAELAHRTTHRRTPPCAAGPYWRQDGHAAHAATCTPAHSGPIRHLLHPYMRRAGFRVRPLGCGSRGDLEGPRDAEVAPLAQEVITPPEGKRTQRVRQPRQLDIRSATAV